MVAARWAQGPSTLPPLPGAPGCCVVAREWGRIGCTGFGGPPAHIALLRRLCVEQRGWIERARVRGRDRRLQLLPGPASTAARDLLRLAAPRAPRRARRRRRLHPARAGHHPRPRGALPGRLAAAHRPRRRRRRRRRRRGGRRPGRAWSLVPESRRRARSRAALARLPARRAAASATLGPWLVLVLLGAGLVELALSGGAAAGCSPPARRRSPPPAGSRRSPGSRSRSARSRSAAAS